MTTVGIIGTAGRGASAALLSWAVYCAMVEAVHRELRAIRGPARVQSGGAAWADHIAVELFLRREVAALSLHLPCRFLPGPPPGYDPSTEEGQIANHYHDQFTQHFPIERWPTGEILEAIKRGAEVWQYETAGFKPRNYAVGRCDVLIALTFGRGAVPCDGGTLHTWQNSPAPVKKHISIWDLIKPSAQGSLF